MCFSVRTSHIFILTAAVLAVIATTACSEDTPSPSRQTQVSVATAFSQIPDFTPTPSAASSRDRITTSPDLASDCKVGQVLGVGDSCIYPGTTNEFIVDASGAGHFLFFTANSVISARNALINGQPYDFEAKKQDDGSWIIELLLITSDVVKVSDLLASPMNTVSPTATSSPSPTIHPIQAAILKQPTRTPTPTETPLPLSTSTATPTEVPRLTVTATYTSTPPLVLPPSSTPTQPPTAVPTATVTPEVKLAPAENHDENHEPGVNLPPQVVSAIPAQNIATDETLNMDVSGAFRDPNGDTVGQYSLILSNSAAATGRLNSVTGELNLTGLREGSTWVTLTACDNLRCSNLGDLMFLLTVNPPPNRPPQAARGIFAQTVRVGETLSVPVFPAFWDFEGDSIIGYNFRLGDQALVSANANVSAGTIALTGIQEGTTTVTVVACDSGNCGRDDLALNFALTVAPPPNRRPDVVGDIPDQTVFVGDTVEIDVSPVFSDPDGDSIEEYRFSHTDRSVASASIDSGTGTMTLRGLQVGTTNFGVEATDGELQSIRSDMTFLLTVKAPPGRPPTVVKTISDQAVETDDSLELAVWRAFDTPERYRIIRYDFLFSDSEVAVGSDISRSGVLTLNGAEEGKTWVSVRACNTLGCTNFGELSFGLVVSDPDEEPNQEPEVIGGVTDYYLTLGESVTLDVSPAFRDPDDDAIVEYKYAVERVIVARGSSISDTGVLRLRGSSEGTTKVSISACDGEDCSDPDDMNFTLTVTAQKN